jgi:hypothetical protein
MLWMAFFPRCHDPAVSSVLTAEDRHLEFEAFYRAHIRKLLLAEGRTRYAAKANYHVARLAYLLRLFPDARFIILVRDPVDHVASLSRQHRWFSDGQRRHPRALAYMRRTGHFEFGLDRRPIHLGDDATVHRIQEAWAAGDDVRGLAIAWAAVYGFLGRQLAADEQLRRAALVVRYEVICGGPDAAVDCVMRHSALADGADLMMRYLPAIRPAARDIRGISDEEVQVIRSETAAVASAWGY